MATLREKALLAPGVWIYRYEIHVWREPVIFDSNAALPVISAETPSTAAGWKAQALCRGMDDAIFFGQEIPGRPGMGASQLAFAREVCGQCPVARECLEHALTQPEDYGVWAGTSGRMRERLRKQLPVHGIDEVMDTYLATL